MRAFSLGARLNYTIANHTQAGILECVNLLKKASWEAIRMELEDILLSKKPSKYLKLMEKLGVLKIVMPELQRCVNCNQDKRYHKHDVFNHVLNACDNIEPNLTLRLAALLHDIGKPSSRKIIDGKVTFHKHEVLGAKEAAILLKRLKFDKETIKEVTHLIRMHMYHYTREWTDSGIRRFIENAPIKEEDLKDIGNIPLFKLRKSDRAGNGYRKQPVTDRQRDFEDRIIKVFGSSNGFTIKDLDINGDILMEYFNLTPGKQIGEILNYLLGVILEYPELNERRELLNAALYFIVNKKEKKKKEEK
jgi:putative nucleotidyltransferase with HDIG domain